MDAYIRTCLKESQETARARAIKVDKSTNGRHPRMLSDKPVRGLYGMVWYGTVQYGMDAIH